MSMSWSGKAWWATLLTSVLLMAPALGWAQDKGRITLFKIVTVKDEIVIGLNADELSRLGGQDAGAVAQALVAKGELTVWRYVVRKGANGELQQTPEHKVGLLAHSSLRVEPYTTPLPVRAHD